MSSTPASFAPPPSPASGLTPRNYAFLQKFVYSASGIVIDLDKQYLLESRLNPIVRESRIASLDALSERLAARPSDPLGRLVVEAMTTNETLFFRDPATFKALREQVLPAFFENARGRRKVRIWSAAASTGQEAYSIAMMLLEMGRTRDEVEIIGTDLSSQVLERASQGQYVQFEVNRGLPAPMLMKYFVAKGTDWQLKDQVRGMVRFQQLDLRSDFRSLGSFDLVLCRNVLIYFDTETKRKIVTGVAQAFYPGGLLVLGCAETVINIHAGFLRKTIGPCTFYSL